MLISSLFKILKNLEFDSFWNLSTIFLIHIRFREWSRWSHSRWPKLKYIIKCD